MNSKLIIIGLAAVSVIGGGAFALSNLSDNNKPANSAQVPAENEAMANKNEANVGDNEKMAQESTATKVDGGAMAKGTYTDYDSAKLANAENGNVVLFFHAPWCPTCKEANKNFEAASAPNGLTLLKVDYDSARDLKKKYGVTYQHTFVQVDKDGKLIKKWNGSNSYDALKSQGV